MITYAEITNQTITQHSLDTFVRHQEVKECWRKTNGEWVLLPIAFTEDWSIKTCKELAKELVANLDTKYRAYGAFDCDKKLIGFAVLNRQLFGSCKQYMDLWQFYVSEPYRNKGIGKVLFHMACEGAKELGAKKIYISAHSSKESIAAYRKLGCVHALEINHVLAEEEPYDVQMEITL